LLVIQPISFSELHIQDKTVYRELKDYELWYKLCD